MKRVQVSEIASVIDDVRKGQTVEIADGDKVVAKLVAAEEDPQKKLKERVERLIAEGKMRRGTGTLPPDFFTRPLPKFESGTGSNAVLEEREESPW